MLTNLPNWLVWKLHDDFPSVSGTSSFINSIILLYSALIGFDSHFCPLIVSLPIRGLLFPHVLSRNIPLGYSSTCYWRWRSPICVFYNPIGNLILFQPFSRVIFREDAKVSCPLSNATISLFEHLQHNNPWLIVDFRFFTNFLVLCLCDHTPSPSLSLYRFHMCVLFWYTTIVLFSEG